MYSLMFKNFLRSKIVMVSLVLLVVIGVTSLLIGRQFLDRQEKAIAQTARFQKEHIDRYRQYMDQKEMGLMLYYLKFAFVNKPDNIIALSIGQRDVNPSIQSVTIRNLEGQKYDTDLTNPMNLLSGNLDLGFVIIYLFPLIIIAFTFNLLSEEQEGGTLKLVAIQSKSTLKFLLQNLSIRMFTLYVALLILFLLAILILSLDLNGKLLSFILIAVFYLAFWFTLVFWIISFGRSSNFNIVVLLSIWIFLNILLPGLINNYVANKYPVPEAMHTMVEQRNGYHEKWDMDKKLTMDKFYAHYPQFSKYTLPENNEFSYLWYYAMQQMGDDDSREAAHEFKNKIKSREAASKLAAIAIPTIHAQLTMNEITESSLGDHFQFLDSTKAFHERMRLYFYPKIFEKVPVSSERWERFTPVYFRMAKSIDPLSSLLPLVVILSLLVVMSTVNMRKGIKTYTV